MYVNIVVNDIKAYDCIGHHSAAYCTNFNDPT